MSYIKGIMLFLIILLLVGCNVTTSPVDSELVKYQPADGDKATTNRTSDTTEQQVLTIWTPEVGYEIEKTIEIFNQTYPNVEVNVTTLNRDKFLEKYKASIIEKDTPDLFMIPDEYLGSFSGIKGLENLLDEQAYTRTYFLDSIPTEVVENYSSFNEAYMYAMPIALFPFMTYYRADILEKEGFPSDPVELAEYMKNTDNYMKMVKELKSKDHFTVENSFSFLTMFNRSSNYFDEQLTYLGNDHSYQEILKASEVIHNKDLALGMDIWGDEGKQALIEDQLVMIYLPSYGQDLLQEWVPEQSGKWRATKLPFGKGGWDKEVGKSLAISSYSDNKDLAWSFIQFAVSDMVSIYSSSNRQEFFGGQDLNILYRDIINMDISGRPTPIDQFASEVWELQLYKFYRGEPINQNILLNIESDINDRVRLDKRALLNLIDQ